MACWIAHGTPATLTALLLLAHAPASTAWDPSIDAYREMLVAFSGTHAKGVNVSKWTETTRPAREFMMKTDPDYPIYHLAAPEGWINDPNGVTFDPKDGGMYHRFYQYDKTYSDDCRHGRISNCIVDGKTILNPASRVWGHTVSRDGATWEDWPGIDADDPASDAPGVYSGNCAIRDNGNPVCIYSNGKCSIGVCAYSEDWVHWNKTACMTKAPNPKSQTNHDSSIWRDGPGGTWYMLSGGCTYGGSNIPTPSHQACSGTGQLWNSTDLVTFEYMKAITPGGPGNYWELPYLLPFNADGSAIDNYHHKGASQYALLFGHGNAYYVGHYDDSSNEFVPLGVQPSPPPVPPTPVPPTPIGSLIGAWPLFNASGKSKLTGEPAARIEGALMSGVGTVFYPSSWMAIPYFEGLKQPEGFTISFLIQLNHLTSAVQHSKILSKSDESWGIEWWGNDTLNFYVRQPGSQPGTQGPAFRGIQANICGTNECESSWVRVAVSYNATAPLQSNIALFADGQSRSQIESPNQNPGTWHGSASATPESGLLTEGLDGVALAEVEIFSGPMNAMQLATLTSKTVPAPAPKPPPVPPAPKKRPPTPVYPRPGPNNGGAPPGWPAQNMSDAPDYYSFNPHCTDTRGQNNATRRLMFGWIEGDVSKAVADGMVPYWQSAHSLMRDVTVSGSSIVQRPAAGSFEPLRTSVNPLSFGPISVSKSSGGGYLPSLKGDALEIIAIFETKSAITAQTFGVTLRSNASAANNCQVTYEPGKKQISGSTSPDITAQPEDGVVELHIFLDRSIVEVYSAGVALTKRCLLPIGATGSSHDGVDLFASGGSVKLIKLDAWKIGTMWQPVS